MSNESDGYIDKLKISQTMNMSIAAYRKYVEEGMGEKNKLLKGLYGGFILGSDDFIRETLSDLKERIGIE